MLQTVFVLAMYIFEFEGVISPVEQRWKSDVISLKPLGLYL